MATVSLDMGWSELSSGWRGAINF